MNRYGNDPYRSERDSYGSGYRSASRAYGDSSYEGSSDSYGGESYGDRSYGGRSYGGRSYGSGSYGAGSYGSGGYGGGAYGGGAYGETGSYGGSAYGGESPSGAGAYTGSAYNAGGRSRGARGYDWAGGYGAGYGTGAYRYDANYGAGYGGLRSDAAGDWRSYAGEGGWLGSASEGYPNVSNPETLDRGYAGDNSTRPDTRIGTFAYSEFQEDNLDDWGGARRNLGDAGQVRARDLMTESPEVVTPGSTLAEAAAKMRDLDVGIIPVVDDAATMLLRGVITDRDIAVRAAAEAKDMGKSKVSDYMTEDVSTCFEDDSVRAIFDVMKREQVRRVPITNGEGRLVGIVAQADLAVDYAGLDLQRETEVEEVIERISEPAAPRRWDYSGSARNYGMRPDYRGNRGGYDYDMDFKTTLRRGWKAVKREARELMDR